MEELQKENINLKSLLDDKQKQIEELKIKLKKYTSPEKNKRYYEKNKELLNQKTKEYHEKLKQENPEHLKEMKISVEILTLTSIKRENSVDKLYLPVFRDQPLHTSSTIARFKCAKV